MVLHVAHLYFSTVDNHEDEKILVSTIEHKAEKEEGALNTDDAGDAANDDPNPNETGNDKGRNQRPCEDQVVTFDTIGGTGIGLDYRHPSFDGYTIEVLEPLQSLEKTKIATTRKVNIRIAYRPSRRRGETEFSDQLNSLVNPAKFAWAPYCLTNGRPSCTYGSPVSRAMVKKESDIGAISYPGSYYFRTIKEAQIKLVYGSYLEHQYEMLLMSYLRKVNHKACFFNGGNRSILVGFHLQLNEYKIYIYIYIYNYPRLSRTLSK